MTDADGTWFRLRTYMRPVGECHALWPRWRSRTPGPHLNSGLSGPCSSLAGSPGDGLTVVPSCTRWPHGAFCPYCGSFDVQCNIKHKTMTHRCRDCPTRPFFSLKTGSVMQGSKLGYQVWAIATYLITTNIKGVSSMKLHRDVKVTQKTAWHLAHRLREGLKNNTGPIFATEPYRCPTAVRPSRVARSSVRYPCHGQG